MLHLFKKKEPHVPTLQEVMEADLTEARANEFRDAKALIVAQQRLELSKAQVQFLEQRWQEAQANHRSSGTVTPQR
jgi:hypothetical protein